MRMRWKLNSTTKPGASPSVRAIIARQIYFICANETPTTKEGGEHDLLYAKNKYHFIVVVVAVVVVVVAVVGGGGGVVIVGHI